MTLTEEQRGTVGFDLERARGLRDFLQDDCAEVGDVWGEMIAEIERLRAENAWLKSDREFQSEEQAARIKELEDAHKRSGAKYAKIINELRSSVYANIPGLDVGKIGPDASKSHLRPYEVVAADLAGRLAEDRRKSWQITEERKAALWHAIKVLKENDIMEEPEEHLWDEEVTVLQAMLTEAE